jgi:hypothetical protein
MAAIKEANGNHPLNGEQHPPENPEKQDEHAPKRLKSSQIIEKLTLSTLPAEILINIATFLTPADMMKFSRTCKLFKQICKAQILWKQIAFRNWPQESKNAGTIYVRMTHDDVELTLLGLAFDGEKIQRTRTRNSSPF